MKTTSSSNRRRTAARGLGAIVVGLGSIGLLPGHAFAAPDTTTAISDAPAPLTCESGYTWVSFDDQLLWRGRLTETPWKTLTVPSGMDRLTVGQYQSWDAYLNRWNSDVQPGEVWRLEIDQNNDGTADQMTGDTRDIPASPVGVQGYAVTGDFALTVPVASSTVRVRAKQSPPGDSVTASGVCVKFSGSAIDLQLTKARTSAAQVAIDGAVTYNLIVTNNGPGTASAGWTVTDLLPLGLRFGTTPASGSAVSCAAPSALTSSAGQTITCTGNSALASGQSTSIAVNAVAVNWGELRNVAYVAPAAGDPTESNPLGTPPVPGMNTNTQETSTNNDGHADVTVLQPTSTTISSSTTTTPNASTTTIVDPSATTTTVPSGASTTTVVTPIILTPTTTAPAAPTTTPTTTPVAVTTNAASATTTTTTVAAAPSTTVTVATTPNVQVAGVEITQDEPAPAQANPEVAFTGSSSTTTVWVAMASLLLGTVFVRLSSVRRRKATNN